MEEALANALYHGNLEVGSELRDEDDEAYYALVQERRRQSPYRDRRIHVEAKLSRAGASVPRRRRENKRREKVMEAGLIAIGAGLAIGLAALGSGMAQSRVGSAAMGAIAEKPELTGRAILLMAIPETLVVLGFAVAAMLILLLG